MVSTQTVDCASCKGTGKDPPVSCPACDGRGKLRVIKPATVCPRCNGTSGSLAQLRGKSWALLNDSSRTRRSPGYAKESLRFGSSGLDVHTPKQICEARIAMKTIKLWLTVHPDQLRVTRLISFRQPRERSVVVSEP